MSGMHDEELPDDPSKDLSSFNKIGEDDSVSSENKIRIALLGNDDLIEYAFNHPLVDLRWWKSNLYDDIDGGCNQVVEFKPFLVFIALRTVKKESDDSLIVENAVLRLMEDTRAIIAIRTSLSPDILDRLANSVFDDDVKRLVYNPDLHDCKSNFVFAPFHVLGGHSDATMEVAKIYNMFSLCQNDRFFDMSLPEAAFVKLGTEAFLDVKSAFFNQLHDSVTGFGCNWPTVVNAVAGDERVGREMTHVPEWNGERGIAFTPRRSSELLRRFDEKNLTILEEIRNINNHYQKEENKCDDVKNPEQVKEQQ